jgi:tetratricopeptide (TPR) repeat protein
LVVRSGYARGFFYARQYERALQEFGRILEIDPDKATDFHVYQAYYMLGRLDDAHQALMQWQEQGAAVIPFWKRIVEARERGWAEAGWEGSVRAALEVQAELYGRKLYSPLAVAVGFAMLGDVDEAFSWLDRAYEDRDPGILGLKASPLVDPLRSDPRFDDLVRRIGIPES